MIRELYEAYPSKSDPITFANTIDLPYLNAVINESMRLMPIVVAGLSRVTSETTILNGFEIPKDTIVSAMLSNLSKDPRIWPEPESFVPERWLGKYKGAEVDRKAFMPFSAGSRSCIGQQ